jgi:integrase
MYKMTYKNKTIKRHYRGNWYVRVRANGKVICIYGRTQMSVYERLKVTVDLLEKETANKRLQKAVELGSNLPNAIKTIRGYTLLEWFDEWLKTYKVGNLKASTIYGLRSDIKGLKDLFNVQITEITSMQLSKAINDIIAPRTKDKVHNLLKQLFKTARDNNLIGTNPASNLPRQTQFIKAEKHALTEKQEKLFIKVCLANLGQYEPLLICLLQGLRKGEMLALKPNDFDFENNTLRIDESYNRQFPSDLQTKNITSNRIMPMFETTRKVLLKYKDQYPKDKFIYTINDTTIMRYLEKLLILNNLPRITLHELRHTFISRCHEKHIDEMIVQKWVGHAIGSKMTKAVYTHITDEKEQEYINIKNN